MACCVLTAYFMNRIIKACELLDLNIIKIQYNDFDDGPVLSNGKLAQEEAKSLVTSKFSIEGMTCAACVTAIEGAVGRLKGIEYVGVSLALARAAVVHDPRITSASDVTVTIENAGYSAKIGQRSAQENLEAMRHSEELSALKTAFSSAATLSSVIVVVDNVQRFSCMSQYYVNLQLLVMTLGLWIQVKDGMHIHRNAFGKGLRTTASMDTLISTSLLLGLTLSFFNVLLFGWIEASTYFSSGSFLTTVVLGGRYLDLLLRRRNSANLTRLYKLQADTCTARIEVRRRGPVDGKCKIDSFTASSETYLVHPAQLRRRDEIIFPPGTLIPCDCYVLTGTSLIDQSQMTGEAIPATKQPGDFLMSGTTNLSSQLTAIVSQPQDRSALECLVESVSSALEENRHSSAKDPGTDVTALMTSYFVRIIFGLAFLSFVWTHQRHSCRHSTSSASQSTTCTPLRLSLACERAMTVLASACPCALGLATPSAVMAGLEAAWARGILISSEGLETMRRLTKLSHVVLDKTGTLTTGTLNVTSISVTGGVGWMTEEGKVRKKWCMLICAAEREEARRHPVAGAVWRWAMSQLDEEQRQLQNEMDVEEYVSVPGKGVKCVIRPPCPGFGSSEHESSVAVKIGTETFLAEQGIRVPTTATINAADLSHWLDRQDGLSTTTTVHIAFSSHAQQTLTVCLHDTLRPEALPVITHLLARPVTTGRAPLQISMLTGDVPGEAGRISSLLSIPVLSSRALPHTKLEHIKQTQSEGGIVAMVGDGVNDAPALAAADVGIYLSPGGVRPAERDEGGLSGSEGVRAAKAGGGEINKNTASVTITSPDLSRLPELLEIAALTTEQARFNLWWAFCYNVVAVALALGLGEVLAEHFFGERARMGGWGKVDPSTAGSMMAVSSVSVLGWSLWLRERLNRVSFGGM